MVPVTTERLIPSHPLPTIVDRSPGTDEEDQITEVPASSWAAEILPLPSSLERTIKIRKGADPLGESVYL